MSQTLPFAKDCFVRFFVLSIGANGVVAFASCTWCRAIALQGWGISKMVANTTDSQHTLHFLSLHLWHALTTLLLASRASIVDSLGLCVFDRGMFVRFDQLCTV